MIKRIFRVALGVLFFVVFLSFLLLGALKFRLLSANYWKVSLDRGGVYSELQNQVVNLRAGKAMPPELAKMLSVERFKELFETNIDRLFDYLEGREKSLFLFLPVKEWKLPVASLGQRAMLNFTAKTPIEEFLPVLGVKPEQIKSTVESIEQGRAIRGYLVVVWIVLLLLAVALLVGHYLLGVGLADRIAGTAWLVMICGFLAKLIGMGAGGVFELFATNSKPPMPLWETELGRSLVGQFFNLGATVGLVAGVAGLVTIVVMMILSKLGKVKEEKVMSLKKKILAFILGVILGFVILVVVVIAAVMAAGGKVNFTAGNDATAGQEVNEQLSSEAYKSEEGWKINFPAGWEAIRDEKWEGVVKKAKNKTTNLATVRIGPVRRLSQVDTGEYIEFMKEGFASGKSFEKAVFVEEPYEERQEGGSWRRFVFMVDYDDTTLKQPMRVRLLMWQYFPEKSGEGVVIMAAVPVESWSKYEKIIKESVDTFVIGE